MSPPRPRRRGRNRQRRLGGGMTQRRLLEAMALVGATLAVLGMGLIVTLPWSLGLPTGGALVVVGLVSVVRSVVRLRSHSGPDAAVPGPPPVLIAALAALVAALVPVGVHIRTGLLSSAGGVDVLVAALLVVAAAVALAVRWSR